ncbi:MAG: transporter permease [Cypionkella sp.]|uniref:ABC transporter permease n=1 Tax=Cypionkella sp. TaxID=2811411 RepID=UPI00261765B5|nr:ABC transporter permease [Cypionkella sp.]MDB5659995.1 transporter permease [Cypionkella sp.]
MFRPEFKRTPLTSGFGMLELIFHAAVRHVRKQHHNAVVGLLMSIVQSVLMVVIMVFMFDLLGLRGAALRGDFVLYIMSGVFNFATHSKTLTAVSKSDGPTSAMMKHSPMNTIVAIASAALGALYLQTLSAAVILFFYHALWTPIVIYDPVPVIGIYLLSWASGIGVGMIFKAATPWQPEFFSIATSIYARANMIFSGKMFLANTIPAGRLHFYTWNPLFHSIDQTRGYMFQNYHPHNSSIEYTIWVTFILIIIGLMGENFTRKYASLSWNAGR